MKPTYEDSWTKVYIGDSLELMKALPPQSVHCCVTSPPYWNLRSYLPSDDPNKPLEIGGESTPEAYVESLVEVFRALRPALHDSGTLWLNLGDCFLSGKQLAGMPWRVAFALQDDGWILRMDCVWSKPSCLPESVKDRPTKSHEYLFLLTKKPRYYFDQQAVREASQVSPNSGWGKQILKAEMPVRHQILKGKQFSEQGEGAYNVAEYTGSRNIRSVWEISTQGYKGSHYATMPLKLAYPCIRAGTSERGVCGVCGAPHERVVERQQFGKAYSDTKYTDKEQGGPMSRSRQAYRAQGLEGPPPPRTTGWQPTCSCNADTIPATVLDPFMGSGTTALAARKLGRRAIGFDLDIRNIALVEERLGPQGVLL